MSHPIFSHKQAQKLEDPERLVWLPPAEIVAALGVHPGMKIADIGAGTGYFSLPMAAVAGPSGHVYAVDLQPEMLALLEAKLSASGLSNISLHEGDATSTTLANASVDLVLLAHIWHELPDLDAAFREARRLLAPGGCVAILDWSKEHASPPGPPQEHRFTSEQVVKFQQERGMQNCRAVTAGKYAFLAMGQTES